EGIVTPMNILEAIAGDFGNPDDDEEKIVVRPDGSLLVAGRMPVDEFADHLDKSLSAGRGYSTVAGLVLDELGHLPNEGESFDWKGCRIEVIDLDGRRIDKLLVRKLDSL